MNHQRRSMMLKKYMPSTLLLFVVFTIKSNDIQKKDSLLHKKDVWITIFVHGIVNISPYISINMLIRLVNDRIDNTIYSNAVDLIRNDPYFYQNQAIQELGLKKIDLTNHSAEYSAGTMARLYDKISNQSGITTKNHYYTYGWSGLLSLSRRYEDSKLFYTSLLNLVESYRKQSSNPKIRIIGYSHGGNICLNLAAVQQQNFPRDKDLNIDELILLATPIQQETDTLMNNPIFKKVYNIYSRADRVQKLDIFSPRQFFSQRAFVPRKGVPLPKKLVQIRIKITRKIRRKKDRRHDPTLNFNKNSIVAGNAHSLRNASPGHSEMWSFGWAQSFYRKETFPLSPIATVAIIPHVINNVQKCEHMFPDKRVIVDIRPENELMLIKYRTTIKRFKIAQFLSQQLLEELKQQANQYRPKNYTKKEYKKQTKKIMNLAKARHKQQLKEKRLQRKRMKRRRLEQKKQSPGNTKPKSYYTALINTFQTLIKSSILICCARKTNVVCGTLSISK